MAGRRETQPAHVAHRRSENGRLPALVPEAQQRRAAAAAAARQRDPAAGIKTFGNLYTRCVLGLGALPLVRGGMPGADSAAAAAGVTAEAFFFQSPGYLTIVMQSNNDVRIIPVDNRPHLPGQVRVWLGDSGATGKAIRWSSRPRISTQRPRRPIFSALRTVCKSSSVSHELVRIRSGTEYCDRPEDLDQAVVRGYDHAESRAVVDL